MKRKGIVAGAERGARWTDGCLLSKGLEQVPWKLKWEQHYSQREQHRAKGWVLECLSVQEEWFGRSRSVGGK